MGNALTRLIRLAVALVLLACTATVLSAPNDDLFRVAVPVESQSAAERARAASEGLQRVLARMSGAADVSQAESIQRALGNAQSYLVQFHYRGYTPPQGSDSDANEELVMSFSETVIERLLREAELPYWPPNRPPVLVWLVEDTADQGRVLVNAETHPVVEALTNAARERGLSLRWPLLDLDDQLAISPGALWRMDDKEVLAASERYEVDTLLVGRFSRTSRGEWLSTWQFYHRGQTRQYDYRTDTTQQMGEMAIDPLADYLARLYAISPRTGDGGPELVIALTGVEDFGDYRAALDYLEGLAAIADVRLHEIDGERLLLSLEADGGLQMLRNTFALDRRIISEGTSENSAEPWLREQEGTPVNPASFSWQGY